MDDVTDAKDPLVLQAIRGGLLPSYGVKLAMSVRQTKTKHYRMEDVNRRLFKLTTRECGFGSATETINDVAAATPKPVKTVRRTLPK